MKNRELIKILEQNGFQFKRSNGHMIYSNGTKTIALPHHTQHSRGLARRLLQQMGIDKQQIFSILG